MKTGIVAFAFGVPWSISSNRNIANISEELARKFNAAIFTQRDIKISSEIVNITYTTEKPENPPSTLRMAHEAIHWAQKNGLEALYIVSAWPHMWRCKRDLEHARKEAGSGVRIYFREEEVCKIRYVDWFCPNSTQERTQSEKKWNKREKILKLMPFWLYELIAS